MDAKTFQQEQFKRLAMESKETKGRLFKISGLAFVVLPGAEYLGRVYKIDLLVLLMPVLVVALALLYISESHQLMRIGRYIRLHIEPSIRSVLGWETWLELNHKNYDSRRVDRYAWHCFNLLFLVYFVGACVLSIQRAKIMWGWIGLILFLALYGFIGIYFVIFWKDNYQACLTTRLGDEEIVSIREGEGDRQRKFKNLLTKHSS